MRGTLSYRDLEPVFDWRMFAAVCGIKMGSLTPEAAEALAAFRAEALAYLYPAGCCSSPGECCDRTAGASLRPSATAAPTGPLCDPMHAARLEVESAQPHRPVRSDTIPTAEYEVRFFECRRQGDVIVSEDGALRLPMLRQGSGERRSLCDLFASGSAAEAARLGIFAIKVDAPDGETNTLIAHAARVCLAEAASEHLRQRFQQESGQKTFMPAVGYPCCPDHSLKRDILQLLDIDIRLTDSCSMIPEASVCGMVICNDEFRLFDIKDARHDELEKYSELRGFDETQKSLYLYSLLCR